ncbi:MAG: sulfite exporter TauE/SafE family protein [Thermoanaerobaculia bacterium]|nr:sulfite exporter TauE/SafE family protein [Thermoanaerobaculia bacterium]
MILAWLGALCVGLSLGLLGSGGSILTVPVLVYVMGQDEKVAIAGSLAIVSIVALSGSLVFARRGAVHWRSVLYFGLPGMVGTYLGAWLSTPVSGQAQLVVFAIVMLLAAALMLKGPRLATTSSSVAERSRTKIGLEGLAVGILTGFVGVGGGFLIVPALVLLGGLSMHLAIGTSLTIIALQSATGFLKHLDVLEGLGLQVDWHVLGIFSAVGVAGGFIGRAIGKRMPAQKLRRVFAVFLVLIALTILGRSWADSKQPSDPSPREESVGEWPPGPTAPPTRTS